VGFGSAIGSYFATRYIIHHLEKIEKALNSEIEKKNV